MALHCLEPVPSGECVDIQFFSKKEIKNPWISVQLQPLLNYL